MASTEITIDREEHQLKQQPVESFKYSKRTVLRSILDRGDGGLGLVGKRVVVGGWVKSSKVKGKHELPLSSRVMVSAKDVPSSEVLITRVPVLPCLPKLLVGGNLPPVAKQDAVTDKPVPSVAYLRICDGSCVPNLQLVVDSSLSPLDQITSIGTSILVEGVIQKPSVPCKQAVELKVEKILHVGIADPKKYPLAKTRLSLEFIRGYPHFRPRTTTVASSTRIRSSLSHATHLFFRSNGFLNVHMPIITTTNLTAHNKSFQITTIFSKSDPPETVGSVNGHGVSNLEVIKAAIKEKSTRIEELKRSDSNKEALIAAVLDLQKANELALKLEDQQKSAIVMAKNVDFSKDFFSCKTYLSISARLHLESYACALSSVYTFGPVFQADDSPSAKNLAEMWMVEVELAFAELEDVMNCVEDFLKFLCQSVSKDCSNDMKFLSKRIDSNCINRIQTVESNPFARITYTEALEVLKEVKDKKFETKVEWGISLSKEHESYLADEIFKRPVIVYDYPNEIEPFYVHTKDDGRTASSFTIIAPKAGVLVRGSQREERADMIIKRIQMLGLPPEQYEWYVDLRRHGTVKHSGFSLGFENLVMFVTGLDDPRDSIPFPRSRGYANM